MGFPVRAGERNGDLHIYEKRLLVGCFFVSSNMKVPKVFTKIWFWAAVVLLFLFAFIFDLTIAGIVLVKSLSSGYWSNTLLGLGLLYAAITLYNSYLPKKDQKQLRWFGRLVLLTTIILTFIDYGYFKMIYFLATVLIFSRLIKWIAGFITKREKRLRFT